MESGPAAGAGAFDTSCLTKTLLTLIVFTRGAFGPRFTQAFNAAATIPAKQSCNTAINNAGKL